MSFFTELKRRNVFRVAALYAVGSWLLLQVGDILFGLMGLPDWALRLVLGILLLGFPAALVLAWIYELTPEGIRRESDIAADDSTTHETRHKLNIAVIAAVALALLALAIDRMLPEQSVAAPDPQVSQAESAQASPPAKQAVPTASIAVLPFADMSPLGDQAYFSDGIAEEILNVLVDVDGLAVGDVLQTGVSADTPPVLTVAGRPALRVRPVVRRNRAACAVVGRANETNRKGSVPQ